MVTLKPGNEAKPPQHRLVPPDYRPEGSFEHNVSDGESWYKLQDRYRIPAKTIIESNFKTTIPKEVNWYLREYVNCKVATPDRYNWCFSTSAREGGIPGRAGKVYIVPNWAEIEKAAKQLTKRYVKQWFELCKVEFGIVDGPSLTINPGMVRSTFSIDPGFTTEFEYAGAPTEVAQGWAAHLQHGLQTFTMGLKAFQPVAYPLFANWRIGGPIPMFPAEPWPLLMSSDAGVASPFWFTSQLMFPGLSHPELQSVVKRHGNWFRYAFGLFCQRAMAYNVFCRGVADPYGRVTGSAFSMQHFLRLDNLAD